MTCAQLTPREARVYESSYAGEWLCCEQAYHAEGICCCCRSKDTELEDSESLQVSRAQYGSDPRYRNATLPPFVLKGDFIDGQTYWIGELTTQWARKWINYWTGGRGTFTTTAMEDTGVCRALAKLDAAGRAYNLALLVRAKSCFALAHPHVLLTALVARAGDTNRSRQATRPCAANSLRLHCTAAWSERSGAIF